MIKKVNINRLNGVNANHIPSYYHLLVSCRSRVSRYGFLGSWKAEIYPLGGELQMELFNFGK
jgi:hypothetical protein